MRGRSTIPALSGIVAGVLALLLAASPVAASISLSSLVQASTDKAFSNGSALARTVTSTSAYLHTVFTRDVIGGEDVADGGPYLGVYYKRGNSSGSTWGASKRVNSSTEHGDYGVIAASSKYVYVAWRSQAHVGGAYSVSDPRLIKFRRNTNHGSSTAWSSIRTLSSGGTRADRPMIAATGARVYVTWTDVDTGNILVRISADYGATFGTPIIVGNTDLPLDGSGFGGFPVVGATGSDALVGWQSSAAVVANTTTNGGVNWAGAGFVSQFPGTALSAAGRSGRTALAWRGGSDVTMFVFAGGLQSTAVSVPFLGGSYQQAYNVAVAVTGTARIGLAVAACTALNCALSSLSGVSILYRESGNNGASWSSTKTIAGWSSSSTRRRNDAPSLLFTSSTRRLFLWNASSASGLTYRQLFRIGTGTP